MRQCLRHIRHIWCLLVQWLLSWFSRPSRGRWRCRHGSASHRVFAQPKPQWVKQEVIRLKALMPQAGCRMVAHHFNRRWASRRQMTVSKTYVAALCQRRQHLILETRRKLKHRVPRPMPRNRVWGCDLLVKTDRAGQAHLALAIVDHASRACLRLQWLSDKSSARLLQELAQTIKHYGRPQCLRTDNEAVLISSWMTLSLRLPGIRHQRIERGCPWQNGRVERFIGTVKRALTSEPIADEQDFTKALRAVRAWYNHDRPHDHLQGRTPAEVWAGSMGSPPAPYDDSDAPRNQGRAPGIRRRIVRRRDRSSHDGVRHNEGPVRAQEALGAEISPEPLRNSLRADWKSGNTETWNGVGP